MLFPVTSTLDAARPLFPKALIDDAAWSRVMRLARGLPDAMTTHYVECRLAGAASQVDYMACGTLPAGSGPILAGRAGGRDFDPAWIEVPAWQRIRSFFAEWSDETGAMRHVVPIAWLEFDLDLDLNGAEQGQGQEQGQRQPVPQVGFCVDPELCPAFVRRSGVPPPGAGAILEAGRRALSIVRGEPLSEGTSRALSACIEQLPEGGRAVHVAAMLSRKGDLVRLVPEIPPDKIASYLERIGWPGRKEAASEAVRELSRPRGARAKIDVDIDGGVLPKFAVWSAFSLDGAAGYELARPLLDKLVARGLCSPDKRDALAGWPGQREVHIEGFGWPLTLHRLMDFKVVVWPDGRLEAKTYLGLDLRFSLL